MHELLLEVDEVDEVDTSDWMYQRGLVAKILSLVPTRVQLLLPINHKAAFVPSE